MAVELTPETTVHLTALTNGNSNSGKPAMVIVTAGLHGPEDPAIANLKLSPKDEAHLEIPDENFKRLSWEQVCTIIRENRHAELHRVPSDLKKYILWSEETKKKWGSIQAFLMAVRLKWDSTVPKSNTLFECPEDTKILVNDWPYGFEDGILHLVVWTKSPIPTEPPIGDMTPQARKTIHEFVMKVFGSKVGRENVVWFKNWTALQSVRSVDHVHVLLRNASAGMVEGWLAGVWGDKSKVEVDGLW